MTIEGFVDAIRAFSHGRHIDPEQDFDACSVKETDKGTRIVLTVGGELFSNSPPGDREPLEFEKSADG